MTNSRVRRFVARAAIATASITSVGLIADGALVTSSAEAVAFPTGSGMDPAVGQASAALDARAARDKAGYAASLVALADSIAPRVGVDPARLVAAWTAAGDAPGMTAMLSALTQLGVSYRYASSSPGEAFDCSGLVKWAWSQAGVQMPSNSSAIIRSSENTPLDQIEPGDVLWYPGHVMIALGVDDTYVHAVGRGKPLEVRSMWARKKNRVKVVDPAG